MEKKHVLLVAAVAVMLCSPASFVYALPCPSEQIYDDGGAEQGYGFNASAGNPSAICQKFIPCSDLYRFSKFSLALTRLETGVENWTFKITMWKNAGGVPGEIMDTTTVTASALPVWPTTTFYDFLLPGTWAPVAATEGSAFIGIQTDPLTMTGVFVGADESTTTPLWPGYATFAAGPWAPVATYQNWEGYRALFFRAEGRVLICVDNDGDGYGDNCTAGPDCNDNDATIHAKVTYYHDADGDGFGNASDFCSLTPPAHYTASTSGPDCDDNNSAIHAPVTYFRDADGDGFGSDTMMTQVCSLTPPAGYTTDNSDVDDTDALYTDILPTCTIKIFPKIFGWLVGEKKKTRSLLIIGERGTVFDETPEIKWESDAIEVVSTRVFFKRFMFMTANFNGQPLEKQEYRVLVGGCEGKITWAK